MLQFTGSGSEVVSGGARHAPVPCDTSVVEKAALDPPAWATPVASGDPTTKPVASSVAAAPPPSRRDKARHDMPLISTPSGNRPSGVGTTPPLNPAGFGCYVTTG